MNKGGEKDSKGFEIWVLKRIQHPATGNRARRPLLTRYDSGTQTPGEHVARAPPPHYD